MIHWRQPRFPQAAQARNTAPGSGGLPGQTADDNNSSQSGGGVPREWLQLRLRLEREADRMETVDTGETERGGAGNTVATGAAGGGVLSQI